MPSSDNGSRLRVMAWNIGFGSRKEGFASDALRAKRILKFVRRFKVDAVAVQEMANKTYSIGLPPFDFPDYLRENDKKLNDVFFLPTVSLCSRHGYPYGKLPQVARQSRTDWLEYGPAVWIRLINGWHLRNLYSDNSAYPATVDVQRPIPHPLYMGDEPQKSAGRDQEDRPALWSRLDCLPGSGNDTDLKVYLVSVHLPTLKGEEDERVEELNPTQGKLIAKRVLGLEEDDLAKLVKKHSKRFEGGNIVDAVASKLRRYWLSQVVYQAERIEQYWRSKSRCVFVLAGDFNFYHAKPKSSEQRTPQEERVRLRKEGRNDSPGGTSC